MSDFDERLSLLEHEIERRLGERFAALRDEFERLRVESDRRWEGFLSRFDQDFHGIVPPELMAPPPAPEPPPAQPAPAPRAAGTLTIDAARALDAAGTQVDTLHRFLDLCLQHASRAALLIARGGGFGVWKAVGFADHGGDDDAVRRVSLPGDGDLARVAAGTAVRLPSDNEISPRLLARDVSSAVLVPMAVKEKISGAVYADCAPGEEEHFDADAVALLTFLAGLAVDRLASRKLKPAPALVPPVEGSAAAASEPAPSEPELYTLAAELPHPAPPPAAPPPPPPRPVEPPPPLEPPRPIPPPRRFDTPEPPPPAISWKPVEAPPAEPVEEPHAEHPSAIEFEPEPPGDAAHPPDFSAPAPPPRPTAGARRLAGPLAPSQESDERRDEARRFARLLVSEIKLYNERAVAEGREQKNLYARLKEDIDRSRQMYDDRIPEDVRASSNFFYEELVRVLADGSAEALGM